MGNADAPKPQLVPFTPPKFHWNQDNLYEQFKTFKCVVEFAFKGQYKKCSKSVMCRSILNWLGIKSYSVYDNLCITEAQKQDLDQCLAAFEKYFKPERNIFQSWHALGSIYSGAFKTQSEFYHKLNSVADNCSFTNKEEIVKFLFLTHNQNTRVHEHSLKEMQDMTSMTDMLHVAHVYEGTVYSKEISLQYLESIKTVKQVDAINQCQRSASKGRGSGRGHGQSQSRHRSQSKGRPSGNCSNCGSSHPPKRCKTFGKECYHCHKKGHFSQYCRSKQHGCSPSQTKFNGSRQSCHDVYDIGIDQSQLDDAPQFEQDSITIEFKCASQWRHSNIMFDEILASASLQRVLTDGHVKSIGVGQSHWLRERFKLIVAHVIALCL